MIKLNCMAPQCVYNTFRHFPDHFSTKCDGPLLHTKHKSLDLNNIMFRALGRTGDDNFYMGTQNGSKLDN